MPQQQRWRCGVGHILWSPDDSVMNIRCHVLKSLGLGFALLGFCLSLDISFLSTCLLLSSAIRKFSLLHCMLGIVILLHLWGKQLLQFYSQENLNTGILMTLLVVFLCKPLTNRYVTLPTKPVTKASQVQYHWLIIPA